MESQCCGLVFVYFLLIPVYLQIASRSLSYYAAEYQLSEADVKSFVDSLPFPLRQFFAKNSRYNRYLRRYRNSLLLDTGRGSHFQSQIIRVLGMSIAGLVVIAMGVDFFRQSHRVLIAAYGIALIGNLYTTFRAWCFGQRLTRKKAGG